MVTVEVGAGEERRWLVLGVTPSKHHHLHSWTPVEGAAAPAAPAPTFAGLLARCPAKGTAMRYKLPGTP